MAISTYAELKDSVVSWLADRTDLAPKVDDFLDLCEADINSLPDFRLLEMETMTLLTLANGAVVLPADYLEWRQVTLVTDPRRGLEYIPPSLVETWYADRTMSPANKFTIINNTMSVYPLYTGDIELVYYAKVPALSSAVGYTTNWLLSKKPNVYLFGALHYAGVYEQDKEMQQTYGSKYGQAMSEIIAADRGARYARTAIRHRGITP